MVTRSSPIWPAIFLPSKVLPGSWRWPVEPWARWVTELPWLARWPRKFQRFIEPAKPLPIEVPVTSTNWPGTKWSAVIVAPTGIMSSSATRNSTSLRFGSTLATAKWPRCALVVFLTLAQPGAELDGGIAVLVRRPMRDDLAVVELEDGDRDMLAGVVVDAAHAELLCDDT